MYVFDLVQKRRVVTQYLDDWLNDVTRRTRRALVLLSLISIIVALFRDSLSKLIVLGVELKDLPADAMNWIVILVIAYLIAEFSLYAHRDHTAVRLRIYIALADNASASIKALEKTFLAGSPGGSLDVAHMRSHVDHSTEVDLCNETLKRINDDLLKTEVSAKRMMGMRLAFDVWLPYFIALVGVVLTAGSLWSR